MLSVQAERPLPPSRPLLNRRFGVRVPGGAPAKTRFIGGSSRNEWSLLGYRDRMTGAATGHLERLPSGSYRVHVYAGTDPLTGRAIRHRQTVKTQQQARIVLRRLLEQVTVRCSQRPNFCRRRQ